MPGKPFVLGPFVGGINTASDASAIHPNELVECVNFELDLDGSLVSRPPISVGVSSGSWSERIYLIGTVSIGGDTYIIGSNADGTWHFTGGVWTLITDTMAASAVLQYNDVAYLVPFPGHASIALAKWTPVGGFSDVSPANLKTMMSSGSDYGACTLLTYKGRMFISPGFSKTDNRSRLIFSDPGDPETYSTTTQFVDVSPGDGQRLMDMIVMEDNLLLFKEDSTYVFTFSSSPSDAELLLLNSDIGVSWIRCLIPFENTVYVYHRSKVYEFRNYMFQCINIRVPLEMDTTSPSTRSDFLVFSRFGERIIVRFGNNLYVYGLRTKTWSQWRSSDPGLHNFGNLIHYLTDNEDSYYAGSSLTSDTNVYVIRDNYTSGVVEFNGSGVIDIPCHIQTKNYDFELPYKYKRMHWWGADVVSPNAVTGTVDPVVFMFMPTWGMINEQGKTWGDLLTWGKPLSTATLITTVSGSGAGTRRRFMKFPNSVRFRQINFRLDIETTGSSVDGPVKIYTLTFIGNDKAFVVRDVN